MEQANSLVYVCDTNQQAQQAMQRLQAASVDPHALSVVNTDHFSNQLPVHRYRLGDQTFTIPGIGHLLVNGPMQDWIVSAMELGSNATDFTFIGTGFPTSVYLATASSGMK